MDIPAIKTQLVTIQTAIPGIQRAYANGPKALPETDLPLFVNFVGPGQRATPWDAGDTQHETRTILMRMYVKNAQAGLDGEAELAVETLIKPIYDAFDSQSLLADLPFIRSAVIASDSGVIILPYASVPFVGVEFRLEVTAFRSTTY